MDKREAVRVGEVLVRLRGENGKDDHCDAVGVVVDKDQIALTVSKDHVSSGNNGKQGPTQKLICNYKSHVHDLEWARNCVVTTLINGEVVLVV